MLRDGQSCSLRKAKQAIKRGLPRDNSIHGGRGIREVQKQRRHGSQHPVPDLQAPNSLFTSCSSSGPKFR